MKINIKLVPSEEFRWEHYTPEDFGFTDEKWADLPEEQKRVAISLSLEGHPEQPYWILDYIETR